MAIIGVAGHELLLDDDGMTETTRSISELQNAEAAVAIVDAEDGDALQAELSVDVAGERVALHAIVLKRGEIPGNDGLRNGGIGGRRC